MTESGGVFDIAFVGGGISATATLADLLSRLAPARRPLRVAVFDRAGTFGGGLTYSGPAADSTLLQNPVSMMPDSLGQLLRDIGQGWLEGWARNAGPGATAWWSESRAELAKGKVDHLFVPRGLYGYVARDTLDRLIAGAWPGLRIELLGDAVTGLERRGEGFRLTTGGAGKPVESRVVVLAPGMIPPATAEGAESYLDIPPAEFVSRLSGKSDAGGNGICILGANAAAMDVLHILSTYREMLPPNAKVTVLSPNGRLPLPVKNEYGHVPASRLLQSAGRFDTADALAEAIRCDARDRHDAGVAAATLTGEGAAEAIVKSIRGLNPAERARALQYHGHALSLVSRRSVPAYYRSAMELKKAGILEIVPARVGGVRWRGKNCELRLEGHTSPFTAAAIVDCRGGGTLNSTPDPLLQEIVTTPPAGLDANDAGSGLVVDDGFCAARGLYVMGDLLTGYDGAQGMVWHLQNAPRIEAHARVLGARLAEDLQCPASSRTGHGS